MITYSYYSFDARVQREAEALATRGDRVDVISLKEGDQKQSNINGVDVLFVPIRGYHCARTKSKIKYITNYLLFFLLVFIRVASLHIRKRYDIIHVNTVPDFIVFTALIPKLLGAKVILDFHDLMPEMYMSKFGLSKNHLFIKALKWQERIGGWFADALIAVNKVHLEALVNHRNPRRKFSIVMNTADEKMFHRLSNRKQVSKDRFKIIYHGTLVRRYGVDIAIKSINIVKEKIPNIRFEIYGDGEALDDLLRLTDDLSLNRYVYFSKQFVLMKELVKLILDADVAVVPNRDDCFTQYILPLKLLEYVAMEIPVISSRTRTIQAYFDDSMVRFFNPGDETDLADAILDFYRHPDRRKRFALNADRFNQRYNWAQQKQIYYQLIDSLVS